MSTLEPFALRWRCVLCGVDEKSGPKSARLSCRVIYVHKSEDACVCSQCDKGPEVTDDVVRRAMLRQQLSNELYDEAHTQTSTAAERAYRKGFNDRTRSLIKMLT